MANRKVKRWKHYHQQKEAREVGKKVKRNRKPGRVREQSWTDTYHQNPDGYESLDSPMIERVVPREERKGRTARPATAPEAPSDPETGTGQRTGQQGTVVEISSGFCRVDMGKDTLVCSLRGGLSEVETGYTNLLAVGDEVVVQLAGPGQGVVEEVLPRRSALTRPDVMRPHLRQLLAANINQVLIVASWREPAIWPELIDRYLVASERQDLTPVICVNKIDLAEQADEPEQMLAPYLQVGYRVLFTSAAEKTGLGALSEVLMGKTTALAGLSGVGKSSLLNAAEPGLDLRIGETNERRHEGRHTTTQASPHRLARGGFVVDTPGIREFGLSQLCQEELVVFYPEIASAAKRCRFGNCTHMREPDCAVKLAVRGGEISAMRFDSFGKIRSELPE